MASIVFLKNVNGITYAYENISYWDKGSKSTRHKRKCIGHVDPDTKEIVPNGKKNASMHSISQKNDCTVKGCGLSLLLDHIAQETGLMKTLQHTYPDEWQKILTCAYFLVSEGTALSRAEKWSADNHSPYGLPLPSQRISELLVRLTPGSQHSFFNEWIEPNRNDEYYALDITSVSSYSEQLDFVRYGYNRDGESLPQINMLLLSGERSNMPLYYRTLPGSIKDVNTLCETLDTLNLVDAKRIHLVMDKGFYSQGNVDSMYDSRLKFMIGVPFTTGLANEQVRKAREGDMTSHENYRVIFEDEMFVSSSLVKWKGHRCYVHVYYDSLKAELDYKKFNRLLYDCHEELVSGKNVTAHERYYHQYFHVKEMPKRGRKVEYHQAAGY